MMPTPGRRYVPTARDAFGPASAILAKELVNNPRAVQWCPIMVAVAYHIEDAIDAHVDGQPWLPSALIALELASRATGILHASVSDEMGFSTDAGIGCITMPLMQAIAGIVGVPAVALMGSAAPAINREPAIAADRLHDALDAALLWVSPLQGGLTMTTTTACLWQTGAPQPTTEDEPLRCICCGGPMSRLTAWPTCGACLQEGDADEPIPSVPDAGQWPEDHPTTWSAEPDLAHGGRLAQGDKTEMTPMTSQQPGLCSVCGRQFATRANAQRHWDSGACERLGARDSREWVARNEAVRNQVRKS